MRTILCAMIAMLGLALFSSTFSSSALAGAAHAGQQEELAENAPPISSRTPLLRKVDESINRGAKYLLARQNADGSFGDANAQPARKVGETALATLALLSCGESHQSPQLAKAIDFLRKTNAVGREMTYA